MKAQPRSGLSLTHRASFLAAACIISFCTLPRNGFAEGPNPFGSVSPPSNGDFQEDDEFGAGDNFGFGTTPPPGMGSNGRNTAPSSAPHTAPHGQRRNFIPPTTTPPSSQSASASRTASPNNSGAPKLADYLELDSSIKGLQVKNFDLPDKDIRDVVTLISKWTGKNFILDSKVRGKITIMGPSQVTLQEAYQAFLSALDANGLTTVESGKFIRIIESAEARRAPVKTYSGKYAPQDDQYITRIFQLKYINSDEVQREFRDMTSRQGKLFAYAPTNTIIITDTGSNIERIKGILDTLDVKGFETTLHVLRIKHGAAKTISDMLGEIYGEGKNAANRPGSTFRPNTLERTRGGGIISKIIPDEATNSLVVMANQAGFESLRALVEKLDIKVSDTGKIHVYYCEYAKASDLASTLAALAGGGGGGKKSSSSKSSSPFGSSNNSSSSPFGGNSSGSSSSSSGSSGSSGPVSAQIGNVNVTSDDATNSLVITANASDYQTLKRVIKKLDIPRLQVFVETAILEINLQKNNNMGNNIAIGVPGRGFGGGFIGDTNTLQSIITGGIPPTGTTIPIFAGPAFQAMINSPGSTTTATTTGTAITVSTFMGFLNFLLQNTNSSVLSTPQIIAMDNEKASFKAQNETPVASGISALSGGTSFPLGLQSNVTRLKSGIDIELTPHVNAASRSIRLEIKQEVNTLSDTGVPQALQNYQKSTISRVTDTTVVVKDKDFIVLGGLLQDKIDDSAVKIPILGDIPILGWLFKSTTHTVAKTNLVILLHPRIIGTSVSAGQLVKETLEKRDKFVEDNMNEGDAYKEKISEVRAGLDQQIERGSQEKTFDYYRSNHEDDEEKAPAGQKSELDEADKESATEAKTENTPASAPPVIAPPSVPTNDNVPLIVPPPPASQPAGGK